MLLIAGLEFCMSVDFTSKLIRTSSSHSSSSSSSSNSEAITIFDLKPYFFILNHSFL